MAALKGDFGDLPIKSVNLHGLPVTRWLTVQKVQIWICQICKYECKQDQAMIDHLMTKTRCLKQRTLKPLRRNSLQCFIDPRLNYIEFGRRLKIIHSKSSTHRQEYVKAVWECRWTPKNSSSNPGYKNSWIEKQLSCKELARLQAKFPDEEEQGDETPVESDPESEKEDS